MKTHIRYVYISILSVLLFGVFVKNSYGYEFTSSPNTIIIPSIHIFLPVITVPIINNTWKVSDMNASYGETTAIPGKTGNTVIFAHSLPHLFKNLVQIKKGDIIYVFTDYDKFTYKVVSINTVSPDTVSVLESENSRTLTLFTCTGTYWDKRFIVKADLISPVFPDPTN